MRHSNLRCSIFPDTRHANFSLILGENIVIKKMTSSQNDIMLGLFGVIALFIGIRSIIPYIKDVNAFIIIFDLTCLSSFYNVTEWIKKIKKYNNIILNIQASCLIH